MTLLRWSGLALILGLSTLGVVACDGSSEPEVNEQEQLGAPLEGEGADGEEAEESETTGGEEAD
ncbi:MAG TPA: hypothetical protein VEZ50_05350 [Nodosilinea sp.]|nr:hypothetical protein [Nodosilinea sp.]